MTCGTDKTTSNFPIETNLFPVEEMLEIGKQQKKLIIGIPRETEKYENRIGLTPEAVDYLTSNGHQILLETGAGNGANYCNEVYANSGSKIVENRHEVFKSDIVLKIAPFNNEEIALLKKGQVIISALHTPTRTAENIQNLMEKKVTAIAFEFLKDEVGQYPVFRSMSEISGTTAVMIASEYLSNVHNGKGVLLGGITGITPTEVTILGANTAGEYAARTALGLGAVVKVFDNSLNRLRGIQQNLGQRVFTSTFHPPVIFKALKSSDVVIGALNLFENTSRFLISEEMIKTMKRGAVVIDISIDQGGCFETSKFTDHGNPVFTKHGIVHYCVPNIPSRVSRTASIALSNIFTPLILNIGDSGGLKQQLKENLGLRHSVYIYNGILTNKYLGNKFNLRSQDIDLLMAVF